ncbi:MAG: wax ester/triacylglycerol synthase family O-acyltransferase [Proteobacteria bacterium]|nr:wax ester/triacylglycerol synthase family O-acyltransferase [Pseudomonadota bacterium]
MPRYAYERLTALDQSFLSLERPNSYMHVASTQIHEVGPLRKPEGGVDAEAFKHLVASSLHQIPRYRQKLQWTPIEQRAVWVDDERFNIDYHVRHTCLPRPGSEAQLKQLSSRIMQQHLDRSRPLWEMWLVEGLEGDRMALISKVHHCMIDGVSGVDLMKILMSMTLEQVIPEAPSYIPRPAPTGFELLRDEVLRRAAMPFRALGDLRSFAASAQEERRDLLLRIRQITEGLGATLRMPPSSTPLNRPIGPHRRFNWLTMSLPEIKAVRKALGGTLNDVVLCVVTGAVRRFLTRRQVNLTGLKFRVMTPVSVRSESEQGTLGNRVSAWLVDLPIDQADPREQLRRLCRTTSDLKQSKSAVGAEVLTQVADWTPSTLLSLGARNMTRLLPFNLVVTNVPGPQVPMYSLGARMLEVFPHVPLIDHLGLGIALLSYDGKLCWGFNADYDLVPDLDGFIDCVGEAFAELQQAAGAIRLASQPRTSPEKVLGQTQRAGTETRAAQVPDPQSANLGSNGDIRRMP